MKVRKFENRLYVTEMKDIPGTASEQRMQVWKLSGISYEKRRRMDPLPWSEKTQALVYFGVEKQELRECVLHHRLRGTHQIVPVGHTLWMGSGLGRKGYDPTSVPDDPVGQKGVPDGFY